MKRPKVEKRVESNSFSLNSYYGTNKVFHSLHIEREKRLQELEIAEAKYTEAYYSRENSVLAQAALQRFNRNP